MAKCAVASFSAFDEFRLPKNALDESVFPEGQVIFRPNAQDMGLPTRPKALLQRAVADQPTVSSELPDISTKAVEDEPAVPAHQACAHGGFERAEVASAALQVATPLPQVDPETAALQKEWANAVILPYGSGQKEKRWSDGRVYRGGWHDRGWPSGEGELRSIGAGGGVYRGQWVDGKLHGYGEFVSSAGGSYSGQWALGMPHGVGVEIWKDGTCYQGTFQHGHAHGAGTIKLASGMIRRVM